MDNQVIDNILISMKFRFKNQEITQKIYDSLVLESKYDPNERAKTTITLEETSLIINIDAKDSVSARAASNSFLKWVNLSEQILDFVEDVTET
ncbi:hypothetical protein EU534_00815 [Candidatus Heimdallarchaeota archaeon]|nr:MAG: hypothetical protein EU534_00815 [Candidatus Heimdallarchaeota archaeon]